MSPTFPSSSDTSPYICGKLLRYGKIIKEKILGNDSCVHINLGRLKDI